MEEARGKASKFGGFVKVSPGFQGIGGGTALVYGVNTVWCQLGTKKENYQYSFSYSSTVQVAIAANLSM